MLCALVMWSCQSETVAPNGDSSQTSLTSLSADANIHPNVFGVCSDTASLLLADMSTGDLNVNYCDGFPCQTTMPEWGYAEIFANDTNLYINVGLAFGWYAKQVRTYSGEAAGITMVNGLPTLASETDWNVVDINPVVNLTQVAIPTANMNQCVSLMGQVKVVKLNFFSGEDANSEKELSLVNPNWNNAATTNLNSPSQYVLPWCNTCPSASGPACEEEDYCDINFYCSNYEHIAGVQIGGINHTSGNDGGYADYTEVSTTLEAGSNATITLTPGFGGSCSYKERWVVFIDWNRDGDFFDSGELVTWGKSRYPITRNFQVPANAETGCPIRMRVAMRWGCWPSGPCCSYYYGEAEDYNLVITNSSGNRVAPRQDDNALYSLAINETEKPGDVEVVEVDGTTQFRSGSDQDVQVEVIDSKGRVIETVSVPATTGLNSFEGISVNGDVTFRVKGTANHSATELDINAAVGSTN